MKLFHIGLHKTGTTFLQYNYFKRSLDIDFRHIRFTNGDLLESQLAKETEVIEKTLFSSERLSGRIWDKKQIKGKQSNHSWTEDFYNSIDVLHDTNPGASIIITIRKQGDLLLSLYKQYVQEEGVLSFDDFYSRQKVISNLDLCLLKRVEYLKRKFEDVYVLNYEDFKSFGVGYLDNFFSSIGVPIKNVSIRQSFANKSISGFKLELLRFINHGYRFLSEEKRKKLLLSHKSPRFFFQNKLKFWNPNERKKYLALKSKVNIVFKSDWEAVLSYCVKLSNENAIRLEAQSKPQNLPANFLHYRTEMYGMGMELRKFGFYPPSWPMNIYTAHGVHLGLGPAKHELESANPYLVYNTSRYVKALKKVSDKKGVCVVSPFVFHRKRNNIKRDEKAVGTIVFVGHSTPLIDDLLKIEVYTRQLRSLDDKFKPLTICLHSNDIDKGLHKHFLKNDFHVVTAGHPLNKEYASKFYSLLKTHKYATSNFVGSYAFYSIEMGIPFFLYGEETVLYNKGDENLKTGVFEDYKDWPNYKEALRLFGSFNSDISQEQIDFVEEQLGVHDSISRVRFSFILYWSYFLYLRKKYLSRNGLYLIKKKIYKSLNLNY